jgi:hypothetical protein
MMALFQDISVMKMKVAGSIETLINIYPITRRQIPEDSYWLVVYFRGRTSNYTADLFRNLSLKKT